MVERCLRAAFLGTCQNDGDATQQPRCAPKFSARAHAARAESMTGSEDDECWTHVGDGKPERSVRGAHQESSSRMSVDEEDVGDGDAAVPHTRETLEALSVSELRNVAAEMGVDLR
jgi:hypothetical protein